MRHGDTIEVEVERLSWKGHGESGRVRVTGAFPGERVKARVEHVGKNATFTTSLEVLHGRAARRTAPCPQHREAGGKCTGCVLMTLTENDQRELKRAELAHLGLRVSEVEVGGPELGYRFSAKRVAFGRAGALRLGSYRKGTHLTANMVGCRVDHPRIRDAADQLARAASELGVAPYDEKTQSGWLRYVWFKTDGDRVLTTLVSSADDGAVAQPLAEAMTSSAGVALSVQPADGSWRGQGARLLRGVDSLTIPVGDASVQVGPLGFLQPNPSVAARLYDALLEGVEPHDGLAMDLYAGAGLTTRRLSALFGEVVPCESHPESAAALGVTPQKADQMLAAWSDAAAKPELVVANPPRKGLGNAVCDELLRLSPNEIRIMSCGAEGLARDLARLDSAYALTSVRAFDTLPQTPHVELIALLRRRKLGDADFG